MDPIVSIEVGDRVSFAHPNKDKFFDVIAVIDDRIVVSSLLHITGGCYLAPDYWVTDISNIYSVENKPIRSVEIHSQVSNFYQDFLNDQVK